MDALIGATGFVGTTLLRQRAFGATFNSKTIAEIRGGTFDTIVCAGAPAAKWIADRDPQADRANLEALVDHLAAARAKCCILISTVDVFGDSCGKDEESIPSDDQLTAYGRNRLWLEQAIRSLFPTVLIVRLPGLVGPGLRKNVIFDFHNSNNLHAIDARGVFQFYPMVNLNSDLETARAAGLHLIHLTSEPIGVADVAGEGFGLKFDNEVNSRPPASYDFQTRHAALFGTTGCYTYSRRESLMAIRAYAQSEPAGKPLG